MFGLVYAGGLALWEALRHTALARWPPFELLDIFGLGLFLPLPVLALLALLLREGRVAAMLSVPTALLVAGYGPAFAPRHPPAESPTFRVLSANILVNNHQGEALAATLAAERADLIAVQELSFVNAADLAANLRGSYPYQALYPMRDPSGLGIFSRSPLRVIRERDYGPGGCACQVVEVEVSGRVVTVFNAHPGIPAASYRMLGPLTLPMDFDSSRTSAALRQLLDLVEQTKGPILLLGDLNTSDRQPDYRLLSTRLHDAYRQAGYGLGYTYPAGITVRRLGWLDLPPFLRLDYVWHDASWKTHAAWTLLPTGADHRAVAADLVLR